MNEGKKERRREGGREKERKKRNRKGGRKRESRAPRAREAHTGLQGSGHLAVPSSPPVLPAHGPSAVDGGGSSPGGTCMTAGLREPLPHSALQNFTPSR